MVERLTHSYDGPLAVFLIGLRIHQPWRIGVVGQAMRAMPRMIVELEQNKAAAERGRPSRWATSAAGRRCTSPARR